MDSVPAPRNSKKSVGKAVKKKKKKKKNTNSHGATEEVYFMNLNVTFCNHLCYRNERLSGLETLPNLSRPQFPQQYRKIMEDIS